MAGPQHPIHDRVRELEDTIATLTRERDEARQRANEQEAEKEMESHAADVWEMDCKKAESDRDAWKAKAELPPQPDDVGAVLREANVLLAVAQHYGSKKWLEDVVTLRLKIKAHLTAVLNAEMVALHTQLGAEDEESVLDAVLRLQRSREDDTVLLGTVAAERDAALAERDALREARDEAIAHARDAVGYEAALAEAHRVLREAQTFIEYARHELQPTLGAFAQFPSQACADTMLAKIAAVLAQEEQP